MMKASHTGLFLLLVSGFLGCGVVASTGPGGATTVSGGGRGFEAPQASKDMVRTGEAKSDAITDPVLDREVEKQEREVLHALAMSLGREGPAAGMPPYEDASQALAELRAAKFALRIEPVMSGNGAAIGGGSFVQLRDSFSERVVALQAKLASGSATPAERAEIVSGSKHALTLMGLKMQVGAVSRATLMTNVHVQNGGLTAMLKIAGMVTARKQRSMEMSAEDYARVRRILTRQKHWEAMAAATMGMLAAYEAVISSTTGDPKALDAIADATLKALPLDPQVSDEDARNYVAHLSDDAASQKAKYESMLRQAYGDALYEAQYKTGIDAVFARAGGAAAGAGPATGSASQVASAVGEKYQADLAKCARGEPLDPGSLVGPAKCHAAAAGAGSSAGGDGASSGTVPRNVQDGVNKVQQGIGLAQAIAGGDATGALQGAADMFPGDGPIQSSLQGVAALTKGDYKSALKSAVGLASLIPGGSLVKEGLQLGMKLLGLFG